jgi:hypothetical protein
MSEEWKDLPTITDVGEAVAAGMEIEIQYDPGNDKYCPWKTWDGKHWYETYLFRARQSKPKTVKVKSLCWRHPAGDLVWSGETCNFAMFKRFPAGDILGEVEE